MAVVMTEVRRMWRDLTSGIGLGDRVTARGMVCGVQPTSRRCVCCGVGRALRPGWVGRPLDAIQLCGTVRSALLRPLSRCGWVRRICSVADSPSPSLRT